MPASVFLSLLVATGNPQYKDPLMVSVQAAYQGSEISKSLSDVREKIANSYTIPALIVGAAYSLQFRQEIRLSTRSVSLPDATTQLYLRRDLGYIAFTWSL